MLLSLLLSLLEFRFGNEPENHRIAIYRLVGNDMPPLQTYGQLRWNTEYALKNERIFPGAHKRWILNRIWNETEFENIYFTLISNGVHRRDIIARCFDIDEYSKYTTLDDKMFYLTSQNEGRNAGIIDGRESGFEWSVILDGNTFITADSWYSMQHALTLASEENLKYMKVPYHRVHSEQSTSWLNKTTNMKTVLAYSPLKGESQVAFHHTAKEMFTLGDTKPENHGTGKQTKGYGQRNKSYMFKDGQICAPGSKQCYCADVIEGNEEDVKKANVNPVSYTKSCGLVLRLWSYPTENVVDTGMTPEDEEGFFCFLKETRNSIDHGTECDLLRKGVAMWKKKTDTQRFTYTNKSAKCKTEYATMVLQDSCFRAQDRQIAQVSTAASIELVKNAYKGGAQKPLCERLRPPPNDPSRKHYLTVFDEQTMKEEKVLYQQKDAAITPLIENLIQKATRALTLGPYSVTQKTQTPKQTKEKRYYYSVRPYYWPESELPPEVADQVKQGLVRVDNGGFVHRDGHRVRGTVIGGDAQERFDRSQAWYIVDNVTTLALAWYYTGDIKFASKATNLTRVFFIDKKTGMIPSLLYAQDGDRTGLIDWKDFYYMLDALVLLENSGEFKPEDVKAMRVWCAQLAMWIMKSEQGRDEGNSLNNHGLYFDIQVLSLAIYAMHDDMIDETRSRLLYRLTKMPPLGHFDINGSSPHEVARPTALHYVTFDLVGWVHAALLVESVRKHAELPNAMQSLWWARHQDTPNDEPVLAKAMVWLNQFLPKDPKMYTEWTEITPGMGVNFPYGMADRFAFDRMLEIVHYGLNVYGPKRIFKNKDAENAKIAQDYPLYSMDLATFGEYSSVDPDAGTRAWPMLGIYKKRGRRRV